MVLSDAIAEYWEYAQGEEGHTKATLFTYRGWLKNFGKWLEGQGFSDPEVSEITTNLIRRYSYSLTGRKLRPRTIRGALHAIRALFGFLVTVGILSQDPSREVKLPKKDAAVRRTLDDQVLTDLLDAARNQASDFKSVRDFCVLSVLIYTGIRRTELLDLEVSHVDLSNATLLVQQGKGQKSRTIPLCPEALAALREWLPLRERVKAAHSYLFLSLGRRRLGERGLAGLVSEVKAAAGYKNDPRIQPHSIRHRCATRLSQKGADLRSIQDWLGHSKLETTAVYLHTDEERLRQISALASLGDVPAKKEEAKPTRADYLRRRRSAR
jgi:integrase/recombinase XerC